MPKHCNSYWPGHNFEIMSASKKHVTTPRIPVVIEYVGGTEFRIRQHNHPDFQLLHFHDPIQLEGLIRLIPDAFYQIEGTKYLLVRLGDYDRWFNMSETTLDTCKLGRWSPKSA